MKIQISVSLSAVELLARCIYCEAGTTYTNEANAVTWVILNRIHNRSFPSTAKDVITASSQFASVTGGSRATDSARNPSTGTSRWISCIAISCSYNSIAMLTANGSVKIIDIN